MATNTDILVTVAAVFQNGEATAEAFVSEICAVLDANWSHYELLLVDNGSTDGTDQAVKRAMQGRRNIRLLTLSRREDEEIAFAAALDNSIGDYTLLMNPDTDPPALVPQMVATCAAGAEAVVARSLRRPEEPWLYRLFGRAFYAALSRLTGQTVDMNFSHFTCLSRGVVNAIVQVKDRVRYLKHMRLDIAPSFAVLPYEPIRRRQDDGRRNWFTRIAAGAETIVASSDALIRLASFSALAVSGLNLLYVIFSVLFFLLGLTERGWASTSVFLASMFGVLFLLLFVFGMHLSVIAKETKKGPLYHVARETTNADLFGAFTKRNVTTED